MLLIIENAVPLREKKVAILREVPNLSNLSVLCRIYREYLIDNLP